MGQFHLPNAATFSLKPPETEAAPAALPPSKNEIENRVIQGGEVDRAYVDQLDQEAHSDKVWPIRMRRWRITQRRNLK